MFAQGTPSGTNYQHLFDLSNGGMGQVALAARKDGRFVRLYAVKRLLPALREDTSAREMFLEEARLAGLLHHPNVVGVTDVGEDEDGPYLVMDYVEGVSARDIVLGARAQGISLSTPMVCSVIAQVARGLGAAHELRGHDGTALKLVHRDVSPHNILVGFDGTARIADFGIARAAGREHRTSTGVLKGKLGYMAPEMLQFSDPTARSDIFSLGIVLYELLTLERLYGGNDDRERARRILHSPPPDIGDLRPDAPPSLQALLLRMLAKDPALRPTSAADVAEELQRCASESAREEGPPNIEEFLEEVFAEEREARAQEIQRRLSAAANPPSTAQPAELGGRKGDRRSWWAIAVLASASVIGAAGWMLTREPDPSGEDVRADTVALTVTSSPPGAIVIADDLDAQPIRTPGQMRLARRQGLVSLRFELDGYDSHSEPVRPDSDGRIHVRLSRSAPEPRVLAAPGVQEVDEEAASDRRAPRMRTRVRMRPRTMQPEPSDDDFGLFDQ